MPEPAVLVEKDGHVLTVTLNRPEALNAMNQNILDGYTQVVRKVEADPEVKVLVFTGSGRAFSAGADLDWMRKAASRTAAEGGFVADRRLPEGLAPLLHEFVRLAGTWKISEVFDTPRLRAASTNSRLRRDMNSARTMRAGAVQLTMPMASVIHSILEPRMATAWRALSPVAMAVASKNHPHSIACPGFSRRPSGQDPSYLSSGPTFSSTTRRSASTCFLMRSRHHADWSRNRTPGSASPRSSSCMRFSRIMGTASVECWRAPASTGRPSADPGHAAVEGRGGLGTPCAIAGD